MDVNKFWIVNGQVDADPFRHPETSTPETLLQRGGGVFVSTSDQGTLIRWAMFASNWSSVFYIADTLAQWRGPYTLEFYLSGWFTQTITDPVLASARLHDLLVKSDIHLRQRTFVKDVDPEIGIGIPESLQSAWQDKHLPSERSLECVYDHNAGQFFVERIGSDSVIARMWGTSPSTFPCQTGHSYDQIISRAYNRVMTTGEPHYDHVLASMVTNKRQTVWVPYQRVIVPHLFPNGRSGIAVMSEVTEVDIKPF